MPTRHPALFDRFPPPGGAKRSKRVPAATLSTRSARSTDPAKIDTQSIDRHAGTTPRMSIRPRLGLSPTMPLAAAGTRPDPAVSVPRLNGTTPSATATADPELDPPEIRAGSSTLWHVP
jgi:hypothetical protein